MADNEPRFLTLDPRHQAPFEIGAKLLATLAFPGPDEGRKCEMAAEALCASVAFNTISVAPAEDSRACEATYPHYAAVGEPEIRRPLRTLARRYRDRMVAARMSLGFFEEGITGQPAKLPSSMARLSLNELSKLVQAESGESNLENIERRTWHDTRPVIHLAAAFQIAARILGRPQHSAFGYDIHFSHLHSFIVWLSTRHEEIVLADQRFGVRPNTLIRIRMEPEFAA